MADVIFGRALKPLIKSEGLGDREIRKLLNTKQPKTKAKKGFPMRATSHNSGEFAVCETPEGIKLYVNLNGRWFGFTPDYIENSIQDVRTSIPVFSVPDDLPAQADIGELVYVISVTKVYVYRGAPAGGWAQV